MNNLAADAVLLQEQYHDGSNLNARIALHARFSTATRDFHQWEFDHYDFAPDARVLEIGCGTGLLWNKNRERIPETWILILSDLSHGMVETARASGIPARFLQCSAEAIPFPGGYFDAVIANHMLYHVPDIPRALGEMSRVLKADGKLYAATNGLKHMSELDALLDTFSLETIIKSDTWSRRFGLENGAALLSEHLADMQRFDREDGLAVTEVEPLISYIRSLMTTEAPLDVVTEQRLRETIAARIAQDGAYRITKAAGMFVARKRYGIFTK